MARQTQVLSQRNWKPDRDFVSTAQASVGAIAAGDLVAAQVSVAPQDDAFVPDVPKAVTLLVDTSASRALGYGRYLHDVRALIAALAKDHGDELPIHVIAFDQDTQWIYSGPAAGYGDAAEQVLIARGAAGASISARRSRCCRRTRPATIACSSSPMACSPRARPAPTSTRTSRRSRRLTSSAST